MCLVNELWDYSPVAATSEAKCDSMRYREDGTNGIHIHKSRKLQNCFGEVPRPEKNDVFGKIEDEYDEFTLNEISNGKGDQFPGLLSLVRSYLETLEVEASELLRIREYLDLIEQRSNGKLVIAVVILRNSQLIFV